jgi:predicted PurR-regulated permease PerM
MQRLALSTKNRRRLRGGVLVLLLIGFIVFGVLTFLGVPYALGIGSVCGLALASIYMGTK